MHELSIALSLLDLVEEEADRRGGVRVAAIHLQARPPLRRRREALLSAYDLRARAPPSPTVALVIEDVPVVAWCPACDAERPVESIQQLCCAVCGAPTPDIVTRPGTGGLRAGVIDACHDADPHTPGWSKCARRC